jgi:glycosyltransferase involved in cell wall biosynthesis
MTPAKSKVLHIITRLDRGGSAQNTLDTCIGLSARYKTTLVFGSTLESDMTPDEKQAVARNIDRAKARGVDVIRLPTLLRRIDPIKDAKCFFTLCHIIRRRAPDIVHTHTSKAGILGRWAAFAARTPHIVHTPHGHVFYGHFGKLTTHLFLLAEKLTGLVTNRLIALTEQEKCDHVAFRVLPERRITVIHSGVPIDRFMNSAVNIEEKKRSLSIRPDALAIGTVGWLLPIKDPMTLLKAMSVVWRRHPDAQLIYVGKGDLETDLREESLKTGVQDRVHFLGWRDDIHDIMPLLDVFALPSKNEGMGRVIVEAMAAGRPIVASRTGGIPDLVEHGQTGWLIPPGDHHAMGEALLDLLDHPDQARRMGDAGRVRCRRFSREAMLQCIESVYADLLSD